MTSLFSLQLQNNLISGQIHSSVFGPQLVLLWLQLNNFSGPIPDSVSSSNVRECYLANNELSGEIPSFPNSTLMLDLGENNFNGTLDRLLSNLPYVNSLILRSNQISGVLPQSIFQSTRLSVLVLDDNLVSSFMAELFVDASFSKLTGLPSNTSGLQSCLEVSIKNNRLSGPLPIWLMYTGYRTYVDVSNNMLTGPSPLKAVKMIYSMIPQVTFVARLDFSRNNFSVTTFDDLFQLAFMHYNSFDYVNLDELPVEPIPNTTRAQLFRRYFSFSDRPQPVADPSYEVLFFEALFLLSSLNGCIIQNFIDFFLLSVQFDSVAKISARLLPVATSVLEL